MHVLASPARVAIMVRLGQKNECIEGEILKDIPLSEAVVARHLKALQQAGLIKGSTTSQKCYYCINWDAFWEFTVLFNMLFRDFQKKASNLECKKKRASLK